MGWRNGPGTRQWGNKALPSVHLVMLTGVGQRGDATAAQEAGFGASLRKPIEQSAWYHCLSQFMGASPDEEADRSEGSMVGNWPSCALGRGRFDLPGDSVESIRRGYSPIHPDDSVRVDSAGCLDVGCLTWPGSFTVATSLEISL